MRRSKTSYVEASETAHRGKHRRQLPIFGALKNEYLGLIRRHLLRISSGCVNVFLVS
jgi:hypothetical protein